MSGVQELSGTVLKGYQLGDRLGWTSHTAVYLATGRDRAPYAVKIVDSKLEPDGGLSDRLRREAVVLADLGNPGIVPIQEAGRTGKLTYAASPFVRARTLQQLMNQGRLDNELAWSVLSRVADALDTVHYRGLVFRGLKPVNILVDEAGDVRLVEFGVAANRVGPMALSSAAYHLTTPQYLAPEQIEGVEPDWRADIYALAVLVFEILTCTPLQGSRPVSETLRATLAGSPPSAHGRLPSLPSALDGVLARAMSTNLEERQTSAWQLLEELVTLPDEPRVVARPELPAVIAPELGPIPSDLEEREERLGDPFADKVPVPDDSMVLVLKKMGVPTFEGRRKVILNTYFASLVRFAKEACDTRWPEVVEAAGLEGISDEEPGDARERTAPLEAASRLAAGVETVFDLGSTEVMRQWGRLMTAYWLKRSQQVQDGNVTYLKPFRLVNRGSTKVEDVLYIFARNLDRVRGERLTAWKQVDKRQFWVVHYDNLMVVGRRRPARSCYFWTAALEATLRWGGVANDWFVEEAECGCVTGTYDCVFTVQHVSVRR